MREPISEGTAGPPLGPPPRSRVRISATNPHRAGATPRPTRRSCIRSVVEPSPLRDLGCRTGSVSRLGHVTVHPPHLATLPRAQPRLVTTSRSPAPEHSRTSHCRVSKRSRCPLAPHRTLGTPDEVRGSVLCDACVCCLRRI